MLQTLRISNLALLEEVSLEFESGFTVVTGETGAGKSILLGALSLLAGERADKSIIRQGAPACEVEASLFFENPARIDRILDELDLPPCEEGCLIIRRSIPREKPPRISVNGRLATLAALQQLGEFWIDFHGPSEPRRLLKPACQLELLDLFARCGTALSSYQDAFRVWRDAVAERNRIANSARLSPDQLAFLEKQLSELDSLELTDEAIQLLERDFQRLTRAQDLRESAAALTAGLSGDDSVEGKLASLVRTARQMESMDASCKSIADRLAATAIELADISAECASLDNDLQFGEEEAADLQQRMEAWLSAKRRFGADVASVAKARDDLRLQLASQGDIDGTLTKLDAQIAEAETSARNLAKKLRTKRENAAGDLAKIAARAIAALGFKKADFEIKILPSPELGSSGDCSCEFRFSPNLGEPLFPLQLIASSGELARVMLALKTVLADIDAVPVLVFDEVDANVGGEIGRVVGEKMAEIARSHQVLCITHLPQVAASGNQHLVVEKIQEHGKTSVAISPLHQSRNARVQEIARMLGDRNAKSARSHAEELLRAKASTSRAK